MKVSETSKASLPDAAGWTDNAGKDGCHFVFGAPQNAKTAPVPAPVGSDVKAICETYNKAQLGERQLGRHFFYKLGRRYQDIQVEQSGRQNWPLKRFG